MALPNKRLVKSYIQRESNKQQFVRILFVMNSNTNTLIVWPCKSHKKIKVERCAIQIVHCHTRNNNEVHVHVIINNESDTIPTSQINATFPKRHKLHHNLTYCQTYIGEIR